MSSLVTTKAQLPAHLQHFAANAALMGMNQAASAGITSSGWPRISIKSSRFRLQSPGGEEVVVPTLDLDVVLVDANPHGLSKVYYANAYDPSVEDAAPDCYSDNGVGPSSKAAKPQCGTCAACPHNVWGSKIAPSGKQTKQCTDYKKVAVLIAANPDGPIFELRIPPASLKNFAEYIGAMDKRGMPACTVVTKLKFDTNADHPKLMFEAAGWATEEQARVISEVIGTDEVDQCTGKHDKPVDTSRVPVGVSPVAASAAYAATQGLPAPVATVGAAPPVNPAFPHHGLPDRPMPPVSPQYGAQPPAVPVSPAAGFTNPLPAAIAGAPVAPSPDTAANQPAVKRTRTRKAPEASFAETHMAPQPVAQQATAFPNPPVPAVSAAATMAPLTAQVTNASLDALIAGVMSV